MKFKTIALIAIATVAYGVTYPHLYVLRKSSATSSNLPYDYDSVPHPMDSARARSIVHDTANDLRAELLDTSDAVGIIADSVALREPLSKGIEVTGIYNWPAPCIAIADSTSVTLTTIDGQVVNTTSTPGVARIKPVHYPGGTFTITNIALAPTTYLLLDSNGVIVQTTTAPHDEMRRSHIFLGIVAHPGLTTITSVDVQPDISTSPGAQFREFVNSLRYINEGIFATPNGANLSLNITGGHLHGLGVNWSINPAEPMSRDVGPYTAVQMRHRLQVGGTYPATLFIDPTNWDNNGVLTPIGGNPLNATVMRIYIAPAGQVVVQYGQKVYASLATAVANAGTDAGAFVTATSVAENLHLICALAVRRDATSLEDSAQAKFLTPSKFGEIGVGSAGFTTANFQNVYDNSNIPQIVTDGTRGGVVFQRGSASDTDSVLVVRNGAGASTARIRGSGQVEAASAKMANLAGSGPRPTYTNADGLLNDTTAAGMRGIIDAASSTHNHSLDSLSNTTITGNTSGEILKWNGGAWVNNTLAEAGIQAALGYTPVNKAGDTDVGSLTLSNGNRVRASVSVTPSTAPNTNYASGAFVATRVATSGTAEAAGIGFLNNGVNGAFFYLDPVLAKGFRYSRDVGGSPVLIWDSTNMPISPFAKTALDDVDAPSFRATIGAGTGNGTVTSVALSAPANMTVSGSPVTTSGTMSLAWNGSSSNLVRADGSTVASSSFSSTSGLSGTGNRPVYANAAGVIGDTTAAAMRDIIGAQQQDNDLDSISALATTHNGRDYLVSPSSEMVLAMELLSAYNYIVNVGTSPTTIKDLLVPNGYFSYSGGAQSDEALEIKADIYVGGAVSLNLVVDSVVLVTLSPSSSGVIHIDAIVSPVSQGGGLVTSTIVATGIINRDLQIADNTINMYEAIPIRIDANTSSGTIGCYVSRLQANRLKP